MAEEPAPPPPASSPLLAPPLGHSVIPLVNKLQDIFAQLRSQSTIELPQVAVVASQSSGSATELELSDDNITDSIPPEITKLWQLELYNNGLTGKIPAGFGNLSNLVNFDASMNYFEGDLSELRFSTNLVTMQLFTNEFSSEIQAEFGEFQRLVNLSLYLSKLTGSLPEKLGSWVDFNFIDLSGGGGVGSSAMDRWLLRLWLL